MAGQLKKEFFQLPKVNTKKSAGMRILYLFSVNFGVKASKVSDTGVLSGCRSQLFKSSLIPS